MIRATRTALAPRAGHRHARVRSHRSSRGTRRTALAPRYRGWLASSIARRARHKTWRQAIMQSARALNVALHVFVVRSRLAHVALA